MGHSQGQTVTMRGEHRAPGEQYWEKMSVSKCPLNRTLEQVPVPLLCRAGKVFLLGYYKKNPSRKGILLP